MQKENEDLRGFGICVGELRRKCAQLELEADQQKLSLDEAATAAGMAYEWRCAFQGLSQELSLIRSQTSADAEICMPEPLADPPKDLRREDTLDLWIEAEVDLTSASSAQQLKQELRGLQVVIQELQACLEEKELENTRITNELSELRRSLSRRTSESSEVLVFERLPPPQDGSLEARLRVSHSWPADTARDPGKTSRRCLLGKKIRAEQGGSIPNPPNASIGPVLPTGDTSCLCRRMGTTVLRVAVGKYEAEAGHEDYG